MNHLKKLESILVKEANPINAKLLARFFKTGKGEYGEGDIFLGIMVPKQREIAKRFYDLSLNEIQQLLNSEIHEKRLIALLILIEKYKKSDELKKRKIFDFYLNNTKNINNWDLVDLSCHKIVGNYLIDKSRDVLYKLAVSGSLWERRIAVISTFAFIKIREFDDSLKIANILLQDNHDLIHKSVGWMLREIGKRDKKVLIDFLNKNYKKMPRTMLRYAIERLDEKMRLSYLKK